MRQRSLVLIGLLLVAYGYCVQPPGANALSRYDLVLALVDEGTVRIDRYKDNTIDRAFADGHYYSDKAIGLALWTAPFYWLLRRLGLPPWPEHDTLYVVHLFVLWGVALPAAVATALLRELLHRWGTPAGRATALAVIYALGTPAFAFATMYFGHQAAAAWGIGALAALEWSRGRRGWLALAGFCAGWAWLTEYPAALIAGALALRGSWTWRWRMIWFGLGGLPAVLLQAGYSTLAFGSPLRLGYGFVQEPQFAGMRQGFFGLTVPQPEAMLALLVGGKGLSATAPVLLLAPLGWWRWWRAGERARCLLCAGVGVAFWLSTSAYYLWSGGWTPGPRFLVPALPYLFLPLAGYAGPPGWLALLGMLAVGQMGLAQVTTLLVSDQRPFPLVEVWLPNALGGRFVHSLGELATGVTGVWTFLPWLGVLILGGLGLLSAERWPRPTWGVLGLLVATLIVLVGLALQAATQRPRDPVFALDLDPDPAARRLTVTVGVVQGPARNAGLWVRAVAPDGQTLVEDWVYPLTLGVGESQRLVYLLPAGRRLSQVTVQAFDWSFGRRLQDLTVVTLGS